MRNGFGTTALVLLLTACGGGGGGSSAPMPAPTIPPVVTPATRYAIEGGSGLISRADFYPGGVVTGSTFTITFTNRLGVVANGQTDRIEAGSMLADDRPTYAIAAAGIDRASGIFVGSVHATPGATVVSPLTTLIEATGDQKLVKRALELDFGSFALGSDLDLRTVSAAQGFDAADPATQNTSRQLTGQNIRLLALAAAVDLWRQGPGLAPLVPAKLLAPLQPVGDYIKATPSANFYTDAGTEALLRAVPRSVAGEAYRDDVVKAAAHLITAYSLAIGGKVGTSAEIGRYMLGIQGYLLPALLDLRRANSATAAAAAMTVTADTVFAATTTFLNTPPLSTGLVFPGPDFVRLAPGARVTVARGDPTADGTPPIVGNDAVFVPNNVIGAADKMVVESVAVPASSANAVAVVLNTDQSLVIDAKPGFTGVAYFDYVVRYAATEAATGRVFVIVR